MHIDKDAAALLAQVIPTLLIVLVLEGRLPKPDGKPTLGRRAHAILRNFTAFLSLSAEWSCLWIVMAGGASLGPFVDASIVIGVILLLLCVFLMLIRIFTKELAENLWAHRP